MEWRFIPTPSNIRSKNSTPAFLSVASYLILLVLLFQPFQLVLVSAKRISNQEFLSVASFLILLVLFLQTFQLVLIYVQSISTPALLLVVSFLILTRVLLFKQEKLPVFV